MVSEAHRVRREANMLYSLIVDKSFCQKFREKLGDENIFDKKRKLLMRDGFAELPIVSRPDELLDKDLKSICSFEIKSDKGPEIRTQMNMKERLLQEIENTVDFSLDATLVKEIPESWEFYDDLLLIPGHSFADHRWKPLLPQLLQILCKVYNVRRVAKKHLVVNDKFRSPRTELLLGSNPWVWRKENGITYHFDVTKSMFCAGNISEKLRVSKFDCFGEVVVDLFAGIGYFTLPYLFHAKADYMYACEWNPNSVIALKHNLEKHGLTDKCTVLEGDNRLVCPHNVADRVNLGLIPQSDISWKTACQALKPTGGVLHIHGNVETKKGENKREKMDAWARNTGEAIRENLKEVKPTWDWRTEVLHIECVKSYAPRVFHLVLDLKCKPLEKSS